MRPSFQECNEFHQTRPNVTCINSGGGKFNCPAHSCYASPQNISKTLWFKDCFYGGPFYQENITYNYVWPTAYQASDPYGYLWVVSGTASATFNGKRSPIRGQSSCSWDHKGEQNTVRAVCNDCLYKP
ncbi:hypothetical protein O181_095640 [Austropuccinia psidii MF-1]|uniref:Uncharacterized protein n=1 Tax=Austropuccinia psidii MF-1 TaxID=1389203 RepID=A0A9Q3J612_9BASI|nr:hypothetical protein [Austropuccinia psidii MF-1]